jgi:hypothetical protein
MQGIALASRGAFFLVSRAPQARHDARRYPAALFWIGAADAGDDSWLAGRGETHYLTTGVQADRCRAAGKFCGFFE